MLVSLLRQYGWHIFPRMAKVILRHLGITVETFYLLSKELKPDEINMLLSQYTFEDVQELFIEDLPYFANLTDAKKQIFIKRFLSKSHSCYGILKNNIVVYYTWISWNTMNYPIAFNRQESLSDNEALLEDSFCHPDYRGYGYHSKMNIYRLAKILNSNKTKTLALVLKENKPALRVQYKSGFSAKKMIRLIKVVTWIKISEVKIND